MLQRCVLPFVLAGVSLAAWSQSAVPTREQAGFATIQQAALREDLHYLRSDALEGRLSLQPGDDKAIQWIAAAFGKAGLKPAATGQDGNPAFFRR